MDITGAALKSAQTGTDVGIKVLKKAQDMAGQDMKLVESLATPGKEVGKGNAIDFTA